MTMHMNMNSVPATLKTHIPNYVRLPYPFIVDNGNLIIYLRRSTDTSFVINLRILMY